MKLWAIGVILVAMAPGCMAPGEYESTENDQEESALTLVEEEEADSDLQRIQCGECVCRGDVCVCRVCNID